MKLPHLLFVRKLKTALAAAAATAALSACALAATAFNLTITSEGYEIHRDIAYGDNPRQRLDIYVPDRLAKPAPVIVFYHGGAWRGGDKADYLFVGQAFAENGFIAVMAEYRLFPEVSFPGFMEDAAGALRFVHDHIGAYGGDPAKLFVAGHSAGGYIAVMLAANPDYLRKAGGDPHWIRGVIGIAGPYDFLPFTDPPVREIFSKAEESATQPVYFMNRKLPPMLLATGDADDVVLPKNTLSAAEKLRSVQSPVEQRIYPGVSHMGIILSLAQGFRDKTPLLEDITRFVNANSAH